MANRTASDSRSGKSLRRRCCQDSRCPRRTLRKSGCTTQSSDLNRSFHDDNTGIMGVSIYSLETLYKYSLLCSAKQAARTQSRGPAHAQCLATATLGRYEDQEQRLTRQCVDRSGQAPRVFVCWLQSAQFRMVSLTSFKRPPEEHPLRQPIPQSPR